MDYNILFNNMKEALEYFKISKDDFYIKVNYHPDSLERFTCNNNIYYHVGKGRKLSSGYPIANQMWYNQNRLVDKICKNLSIAVFEIYYDNKVIYIGNYIFDKYEKKIANNGFTYFEFKLLKIKY